MFHRSFLDSADNFVKISEVIWTIDPCRKQAFWTSAFDSCGGRGRSGRRGGFRRSNPSPGSRCLKTS